MIFDAEITGGADEFEAAVIAAVLDRLDREEGVVRRGAGSAGNGLPAWIRVNLPEESRFPWERVTPD